MNTQIILEPLTICETRCDKYIFFSFITLITVKSASHSPIIPLAHIYQADLLENSIVHTGCEISQFTKNGKCPQKNDQRREPSRMKSENDHTRARKKENLVPFAEVHFRLSTILSEESSTVGRGGERGVDFEKEGVRTLST